MVYFIKNTGAFKEFMKKTEVEFMLNGQTEESCFILRVPDDLKPEDIQLMADVVLDSLKAFDKPAIMVDETEQKYKIVISNNREPETPFGGGDGSKWNPYRIESAQHLANLAYMVTDNNTEYKNKYLHSLMYTL